MVRRWERRIALAYGMLGREEDARDATRETFWLPSETFRGFQASEVRRGSPSAVNQCIYKGVQRFAASRRSR